MTTVTAPQQTPGDGTQSALPPPLTDDILDLDAVPGQIGHAVLRAADGHVVRHPTGSLTSRDAALLYRALLEAGTVLCGEGLERLTVGFRNVSYAVVMGRGDGCLYIVKKRSSP